MLTSQSNFDLLNKPNLRLNLTVSARGSGLCLYLPKDTCQLFGIVAGHVIVTELAEHYKPREVSS